MTARGGDFLKEQISPADTFTPEDFSEEHSMIRDLAERFVNEEVLPRQESIERQEWGTTVGLLRRCGEMGLLGIEVPREYGGENLDKVSAMIVAERFARFASFGVSYGGQAGIGTLPLVYFGTEELKKKYLPALCKGDKLSAYALSEAESGSDALSARTTATLSPDRRHWMLNGEKMWITNAAFADLFMTFAQVDGREFTCFAVEKRFPGVSTGEEERKMGLKGSSTRPLILNNAQVPVGNVVGAVGKGHHVAFNILNLGRAKLGAIAAGAGKAAVNDAIAYARHRVAFGRSISSFGAIQQKLAEMALRTWVVESMVYRTAAMLDSALAQAYSVKSPQPLQAIREYAVECSILKVFGSEALDYVVDEAVQIFGGYGYSAEYPVERYYRDARVNRIFEGTNEINRLLISGTLIKGKAFEQAPIAATASGGTLAAEFAALQDSRNIFRWIGMLAVEKFGDSIREQQEILMYLSDIAMEIFAMDAALTRAHKSSLEIHRLMATTFLDGAVSRITAAAVKLAAAISDDTALCAHLSAIRERSSWIPIDGISTRRTIAAYLLDSRPWV